MSELDVRQVRAAENQSLFRTVNERLVALNETFEDFVETALFVCECADTTCIERIKITLPEYRRIRENPRRFFVAPSEGHVLPEVENVVEARERYFVVEKIEDGAKVAEQLATE
jgi:hypothetical protein